VLQEARLLRAWALFRFRLCVYARCRIVEGGRLLLCATVAPSLRPLAQRIQMHSLLVGDVSCILS